MSGAPSHSPEKKDSDFFTEHTQVSAHKNVSPHCHWRAGALPGPRLPLVTIGHSQCGVVTKDFQATPELVDLGTSFSFEWMCRAVPSEMDFYGLGW